MSPINNGGDSCGTGGILPDSDTYTFDSNSYTAPAAKSYNLEAAMKHPGERKRSVYGVEVREEADNFLPHAVSKVQEAIRSFGLEKSEFDWQTTDKALAAVLRMKTDSGLIVLTIACLRQKRELVRQAIALEAAEFSLFRDLLEVVDKTFLSMADRINAAKGSVFLRFDDFTIDANSNRWGLVAEVKSSKVKEIMNICTANSL